MKIGIPAFPVSSPDKRGHNDSPVFAFEMTTRTTTNTEDNSMKNLILHCNTWKKKDGGETRNRTEDRLSAHNRRYSPCFLVLWMVARDCLGAE